MREPIDDSSEDDMAVDRVSRALDAHSRWQLKMICHVEESGKHENRGNKTPASKKNTPYFQQEEEEGEERE